MVSSIANNSIQVFLCYIDNFHTTLWFQRTNDNRFIAYQKSNGTSITNNVFKFQTPNFVVSLSK